MTSGLHEYIRVGAVFEKGWPKPIWIDYNGHKITVKNIFYRWKEKFASYHIVKFSFSDLEDILYEIEFNPVDMKWHLLAFGEHTAHCL